MAPLGKESPPSGLRPFPANEVGRAPGQCGNIPGQPRALASQFLDNGFDKFHRFRMAHDEQVASGQQQVHGSDGFHEDAPLGLVAQLRRFFIRLFALFHLPHFLTDIVDDGELQLVVFLGQSRHAVPLHDGVAVFQAVTQAAGGGINQDVGVFDPQLAQQDVQLFGQVDVDGGVGDDRVAIGQGRGADLLVVLVLDRADDDGFVAAGFRHRGQHFGILFDVAGAEDDEGHVDGRGHLLGRSGGRLGGGVVPVGVGAVQDQGDGVGPKFLDAFLGPGHRVFGHVFDGGIGRGGPLFARVPVPHFHGNPGLVGHGPFKDIEGVGGLASQGNGFIAFADGYGFDRTRVNLFGNLEGQGSSLLNFFRNCRHVNFI